MKLKNLLILSIPLLLASCGGNAISSNIGSNETSSQSRLFGNNSNEESIVLTSEESKEESTLEESIIESSEEELLYMTKEVIFDNCPFTAQYSASGASKENNEKFLNLFNTEDEIATRFEANNVNIDNQCGYVTLRLGTQKADGSFTLGFDVTITKIALEVQAYWKYIEYNSSYSIDTDAYLEVNGQSIDFSGGFTSTEPYKLHQEFQYDIEDDVRTISLSTKGERSRVYVHSMAITYIQNA